MRSVVPLLVVVCVVAGCASRAGAPSRRVETSLAREVAREIDLLRSNPKAYAKHLRALRAKYDGKLLRLEGRDPIRTREGTKPLEEAIKLLERTRPLGKLRWEPGLARAADDHVKDIGGRGVLDHFGAKGESPLDRVARFVVYLLVGDGVPDRGHRHAFLDKRYEQVGVGCGAHARFRTVCVMDFAAGYASLVR